MNDVEVVKGQGRALTAAEFYTLAEVPPEIEWFANLRNPNTRKAYESDLGEFRRFVGIRHPEEFRTVTRAHVIAWRKDLERRVCAPTTIQRKLLANFPFQHLPWFFPVSLCMSCSRLGS